MLITFDIKTKKMFKNALIFAVVGIKRNLMAVLGMALIIAICFAIAALSLPIGLAIGIVVFFACAEFIKIYAAYPVIERYKGRTADNAPEIDSVVFFKSSIKIPEGTFVQVRIKDYLEYDLIGEII